MQIEVKSDFIEQFISATRIVQQLFKNIIPKQFAINLSNCDYHPKNL